MQSLSLDSLGGTTRWNEYQVDAASGILELFSLPTLTKITVSRISVFPLSSAFRHSHQLKTLALIEIKPLIVVTPDRLTDSAAPVNNRLVEDMGLDSLRIRLAPPCFVGTVPVHAIPLQILIEPHILPGIARLRELDVGLLTLPVEVELCQKILEFVADSLHDLATQIKAHRAYNDFFPSRRPV
jgi:hypothetical protein